MYDTLNLLVLFLETVMTKRHRHAEVKRSQAGARSTPALVSATRQRAASSSSEDSGSDSFDDQQQHSSIHDALGTKSKSDLHLLAEEDSPSSDADFDSSEVGDDGNNDDDDSSSALEEDEEEAQEADDDDEEGEDETEITVHFDVNEMAAGDASHLYHLIDQLVPDHMEEVDRDQFGDALLASPYTSVVKLGGEESADETEVFGLFSILDVAHALRGPQKNCFAALCKLLRQDVWLTVEPGISSIDVLTAFVDDEQKLGQAVAEERRSKAVLLVQEYIRNVPLELTSRILQHSMTSFRHDAQRWSKKRDKSVPLFTAFPCMFVVLAKIQRSADSVKRSTGKGDAATPSKKKKQRSEAASTGPQLDMREFIFWREEDETLYSFRDKRVAVAAFRCRAQYDGQPQSEIPLTLSFALTNEGLEQATAAIKKRETIVPLPGNA